MLRVALLGRFDVVVDGAAVAADEWPSKRAAQLVALLALSPNGRLPSEQVMDALWPELEPEAARANLHKAATYARQALGRRDVVVLRGGTVALDPNELHVDVHEFELAARAALAAGDPDQCAAAADSYAGELLPDDPYEEWVLAPRERLHRLRLDLLRCAGRWADLIELDPADEHAHRELMAEHHRAGRLHAAIHQFQQLRSVLARDLAVAPSAETLALYRRILGSAAVGWTRPALVGREVELVRARAALRRASEGRAAAIVVSGPAGIGKTRLCEELVDQAAAEGWFVLRAGVTEESSSIPYGPLLEALEAAVIQNREVDARLDPRDRDLLVHLDGTSGHERVALHRHTIARLVARAVRASGASRAALFLDDLHLADEATLGVAGMLASAPPPRGMLLVAACRSDQASPALDALLQVLRTSGASVEIPIGPLSRRETDDIVATVAGRDVSAEEGEAVWALSGGNPFFASEVAASLAEDVPLGTAGATAVLMTRLARIDQDARQALRATAIVTDELDAETVAAVGRLTPDAAVMALRDAADQGIIASHEGSYRFRHDLVRAMLMADASEAERREVHARLATWLADRRAPPGRVAHHLLAAGHGDEALPFLRAAGEHAMAVGAHRDAVALADAALALAPGDAAFLGTRADGLFAAGDPAAAAAYAVAIAASKGGARSSLAVRRARALVLSGDIPEALKTLDAVGTTDAADHVQHLVTRGLAVWCTGALDDAAALGDEARRLAEASGELRDFVDATMLQAMVAHEQGAWPQRAALDLLDAQLRPDLATVVIDAHLCVAESYLYGGVSYEEVIAFASDLRARAARADIAHAEAFAVTLLGEAHLLSGDVDAAVDLLRTGVDLYRRVGVLCGEALSLQRLAEAQLASGDGALAQVTLGDALVAARGSPVATRHLLDRIHGTAIRAADDPQLALAAVDEALHAVQGPLESCPPCSVNRTVPSAIACADAGDRERARQFLGFAEQVVSAFYPQGGWHAALDEARSHVARAEGDEASADRLLRQAIDGFDRAGQVLDAQRCRAATAVGKV